MHTNQILLSSNRLELSPWSFTNVSKKIETIKMWNYMSKVLRFLHITAEHQDCLLFTIFLTIKTCSYRKNLPWTILEEQFPVTRNTATSKIGNGVISLLWQLRCHCNPDHNKFSSLSNATVVAIFPTLCLWWRSLCLNLGGIDPQKLYRATLRRSSAISHWLISKGALRQ